MDINIVKIKNELPYTDGEDHSNMLMVNAQMLQMLMYMRHDYPVFYHVLPAHAVMEKVNGCHYLRVFVFADKNVRDRAYRLFSDYSKLCNVDLPFFYKGEYVTSAMIDEIAENKGDFSVLEKYIFKDSEKIMKNSEK